jgi:hypothetical protein
MGQTRTWFCILLFLFSGFRPAIFAAGQKVDKDELPRILAGVADYCRKFADASLYYVCLEEVTEVIYRPYRKVPWGFGDPLPTTRKNHYVYDYQLIQKDYTIKEQRILLEENGVKKNVKDAPLQVERFRYKHIILGPMLLNDYWQSFHDYRIIARERFRKEPCFVIEAVPKSEARGDHLFGKFWVSERDFRVWRMEWNQESVDNYKLIEQTAETLKARPHVQLSLEMGFEEKGIRFPSRYIQQEEYITLRGAHLLSSKTTVNYRTYKFFAVETEVEIKRNLPEAAAAM